MTALSYCLISRALTREDSFNALVEQMRGQDQFVLTPCACVPACAQVTREQVAELDRRVGAALKVQRAPKTPDPETRRFRLENNLCIGCGGPAKYFGVLSGYGARCEACSDLDRERRKKVRFIVSPV